MYHYGSTIITNFNYVKERNLLEKLNRWVNQDTHFALCFNSDIKILDNFVMELEYPYMILNGERLKIKNRFFMNDCFFIFSNKPTLFAPTEMDALRMLLIMKEYTDMISIYSDILPNGVYYSDYINWDGYNIEVDNTYYSIDYTSEVTLDVSSRAYSFTVYNDMGKVEINMYF